MYQTLQSSSAQTAEQAGSAGPASAMLFALLLLFTAPKQVKRGRLEGFRQADNGRTVRQHFSGKARNAPDRKTAAHWVRSVAVSPAPPPPDQTSAGERH